MRQKESFREEWHCSYEVKAYMCVLEEGVQCEPRGVVHREADEAKGSVR